MVKPFMGFESADGDQRDRSREGTGRS